ncbi:MAG: MoaD/ThiS family protein [Kiritimatiellia bacterium]
MKQLLVEYVAMMREAAGCREERVETEAENALELYGELTQRHGWAVGHASLRVAINDSIVEWSAPVRDGDRILFLPPSSGG